MRKNRFIWALAMSPLLLGAGQSQHALTVTDSLAQCESGQYLVYRGGKLACETISGGTAVTLPTCSNQLLASTRNGDVTTLGCTDRGKGNLSAGDLTILNNIKNEITKLGTDITTIEMNPPAAQSSFVGITTATTNGEIKRVGSNTGLDAANGICADQYGAGAHMCSMPEVYHSVRLGKFKYDGTGNIPKSWIFFPAWNGPGINNTPQYLNGVDPLAGISDTCASHLYPTGDQRWTGIAMEWTIIRNNNYGLKFHGGANARCNAAIPIACCK